MTNLFKGISFFLFIAVFTSCGSSSADVKDAAAIEAEKKKEATDELTNNINEALEGMEGGSKDLQEAIKNMADAVKDSNMEDVEVVNFRDMKELLPKKVAGMELVDSEGSTSGAFGFKASTLTAKYAGDGKSIKIEIVDTGGIGKTFLKNIPWATMEVDKESSSGYERTTEINGYKAFEEYNNSSERGSIALFAGERFVIKSEGRGVKMKTLKNSIDDLPIKKLIKLGNKK